jgi:hypothetical protein
VKRIVSLADGKQVKFHVAGKGIQVEATSSVSVSSAVAFRIILR